MCSYILQKCAMCKKRLKNFMVYVPGVGEVCYDCSKKIKVPAMEQDGKDPVKVAPVEKSKT